MTKDDFNRVKLTIGERLELRCGSSNDRYELTGIFTGIGENSLWLQTDDGGETLVEFDEIRTLRKLGDPTERKSEQSESLSTPIKDSTTSSTPSKTPTFTITRTFHALMPSPQYEFAIKDRLETIRQLVRELDNQDLRRDFSAVCDSLDNAIRQHSVKNNFDNNLRARLLTGIWNRCNAPAEYKLFCLLLGVAATGAEDYRYARQALLRAREYALAAYAASEADQTDDAEIFTMCSLLSRETSNVGREIGDICLKRHDVDVLLELLEVYANNDEVCEKLAECAYLLFEESGGKLTSDISPELSAREAAIRLLDAIPPDWKQSSKILELWENYQHYAYPEPIVKQDQSTDPAPLVGCIFKFDEKKNFGFINPGHYFYIKQVFDGSERGLLLRKLLALGLWNNLEVQFKLGVSIPQPDRSAATHIELTEASFVEVQRRLSNGNRLEGLIEAFFPAYHNGRIIADGKRYNFDISSIVDPWLRAYYGGLYMPSNQEVSFEVNQLNKASNICWINYNPRDREMFDSVVTAEDRREWDQFLRTRDQKFKLPDYDPYQNYTYEELVPWVENKTSAKPSAREWLEIANLPLPSKSEEVPSTPKTKTLTDFESKEFSYREMLRLNGFNESTVCDLAMLYLQWDGKAREALDLLNVYESRMDRLKLLQVRLMIYDKIKDYAQFTVLCEKLLPILERQMPQSASQYSHRLCQLINARIKLGQYREALKCCDDWFLFYSNNRHLPEASKFRNALNGVKRFEAICYYYLGDDEKAVSLARELQPLLPTDWVINQILSRRHVEQVRAELAARDTFDDPEDVDEIEDTPTGDGRHEYGSALDEIKSIEFDDPIDRVVDMIVSPDDGSLDYARAIGLCETSSEEREIIIDQLKDRLRAEYADDILIWDLGSLRDIAAENSEIYAAQFLNRLLNIASIAIDDNDEVADAVDDEKLEPPLYKILMEPEHASQYFDEYMERLNDILERDGKIVVLLANELTALDEPLRAGTVPREFLSFSKKLLQDYRIFMIIVDDASLEDFAAEYSDELPLIEFQSLT